MPDAIKAAFTNSLELETANSNSEVPKDLQYMPPGTHRINASRNGKPVTLDITVDASTAETLNAFLQAQLALAKDGTEDRPFFDFNHEDREAAAWPTAFYWAGEDTKAGGVRAKIEWSGAGEKALQDKTFRRFSPTFIPDENGKVIGSETNMGGLVNRAAFKRIQPLFAKGSDDCPQSSATSPEHNQDSVPVVKPASESAPIHNPPSASVSSAHSAVHSSTMIKAKLHALEIIDSINASDESAALAIEAKFTQLETENRELKNRIEDAVKAKAADCVEAAIKAGRIAPKDEQARAFWIDAYQRDPAAAAKAIEAIPVNPVLAKVAAVDDPAPGILDRMQLQQKKIAEVQAANPGADFQTVFTKAHADDPQLFS